MYTKNSRNHYAVYVIGGVLLIPIIVYGTIRSQDQARTNSFNHYKLKGRIRNF